MPDFYPECAEVCLASINIQDTSFSLRPESDLFPDQNLLENIQETGLLHPPLLLHHEQQKHSILSGRKRILAANQLGWRTLPCLLLQQHTPNLLKWKTTLNHALIGSQLSCIEQATLFHKAAQELDPDALLSLLPMLGYKKSIRVLETFARALTLCPSLQNALHRRVVHEKHIDLLATFARRDQETITRLIERYQLGGSKQRNLLLACLELCRRQNCSVADIMEEWQQAHQQMGEQEDTSHRQQKNTVLGLHEKKKDRKENKPQQITDLFAWLSHRLYPRLHGAEQEFRSFVHEMQLPESCSLLPTPHFEDEELSLTVRFSDQECFRRQWQAIRQVLENSRE